MQSHEGRIRTAGNQLELWAEPGAPPMLGLRVLRRDGRESAFDLSALADSIRRAGWPGEALDGDTARSLARAVRLFLQQSPQPIAIDTVRQTVERLLVDMGYTLTARMYAGAFAPPMNDAQYRATAAGMFDEALPLDRAERFLAAAAADAGLERAEADALLVRVLEQIRVADVQRLTPGLLREWMRSELHARGLTEPAARLARLSLPVSALHDAFTENDRPPSTAPGDPESAALALAGRVSAAYVLGQLLPSFAGQAHLRGDIQVRGIGNFLRLDSVQLGSEHLRIHGGIAASVSATPESLVASLMSQSQSLSRFFGGRVAWPAINFGFAPLIENKTDEELNTIVRALLSDNGSAGDSVPGRAAAQFAIAWDAPEHMRDFENAGGDRIPVDSLYPMARLFFVATLAGLAELSEHGSSMPPASMSIHLSPYFFGAPESEHLLELLGRIVVGNFPVALHYDCPAPQLFDTNTEDAGQSAVAQTVTLAVARTARASTDLEDFLARLETHMEAAVAAHRAKREFLLRVFAERSGPLSFLRTHYGDGPLANPDRMRYRIALEDASVAALERAGVPWIAHGDAPGVAEAALHHLRESSTRWSTSTNLLLGLADADATKSLNRTLGGAAPRHVTRPLEALALEAGLHPLYDEAPFFTVSGESFATPADAAEFVRRAFLHTPCRALRFV